MSALSPTGADQPNLDDVYKTSGNQASKDPIENAQGQQKRQSGQDDTVLSERSQNDQSSAEATASSLGRGIRGAPPGEETKGHTQQSLDSQELDAQQMAAPGEGDVYEAVEGKGGKSGASGAQPGLESDLDRKKAEQSEARAEVKAQKQEKVDVAGVLGQSEAPADPTEEKMRA